MLAANYMIEGYPAATAKKIWQCVTPLSVQKIIEYIENDVDGTWAKQTDCTQPLIHKEYFLNMAKVAQAGIPVICFEQRPGMLVIVDSNTFHQGYNEGGLMYNSAVNLMPQMRGMLEWNILLHMSWLRGIDIYKAHKRYVQITNILPTGKIKKCRHTYKKVSTVAGMQKKIEDGYCVCKEHTKALSKWIDENEEKKYDSKDHLPMYEIPWLNMRCSYITDGMNPHACVSGSSWAPNIALLWESMTVNGESHSDDWYMIDNYIRQYLVPRTRTSRWINNSVNGQKRIHNGYELTTVLDQYNAPGKTVPVDSPLFSSFITCNFDDIQPPGISKKEWIVPSPRSVLDKYPSLKGNDSCAIQTENDDAAVQALLKLKNSLKEQTWADKYELKDDFERVQFNQTMDDCVTISSHDNQALQTTVNTNTGTEVCKWKPSRTKDSSGHVTYMPVGGGPSKAMRKSNIKKYLLRKHKVKPYRCGYCEKAFVSKQNADRHIKLMHTNAMKPYYCKSCKKCFATESIWLSHIKNAHAEQKYSTNKGYWDNQIDRNICEKINSSKKKTRNRKKKTSKRKNK